jgi:hypothetical protein
MPRQRLAAGIPKWLHLDKAAVSRNAQGANLPTIAVRTQTDGFTAHRVRILGPSEFIYDPQNPLPPAGTYAWIETTAAVECD